jgi:hypothetical protein
MAKRLVTLLATQVARVRFPVQARPTFRVERWPFFCNPASGGTSSSTAIEIIKWVKQFAVAQAKVFPLVSDRKWFRPNLSTEYLAKTEYSARATETEIKKNSAFFYLFPEKNRKTVTNCRIPRYPERVLVIANCLSTCKND